MDFNYRSIPVFLLLTWVQFHFIPDPMLVLFLFIAMCLDLLLGISLSHKNNIATKSSGLKLTLEKLMLYIGSILGVWILVNVVALINVTAIDYTPLVNYTIAFMITVEIYSIMENGYALKPQSPLSRFFLKPMLQFLRGTLSNHPFNKKKDD